MKPHLLFVPPNCKKGGSSEELMPRIYLYFPYDEHIIRDDMPSSATETELKNHFILTL